MYFSQPSLLAGPALNPRLGEWHGFARSARDGRRLLRLATVAALHLLAAWVLLQSGLVQRAVAEAAPVIVRLVTPVAAPAPPLQARLPPLQRPTLPTPPAPLSPPPVTLAEVPAPAVAAAAPPAAAVAPEAAATAAPAAAAAGAATVQPPPPPRELPSSAVAYLVRPPVEVPMASRRLREAGTVLLRVRVGTDGVPREVHVQRSSGHPRLDAQAVWAMKQARFAPQVERGVPIEWIVVQAVQYEVD